MKHIWYVRIVFNEAYLVHSLDGPPVMKNSHKHLQINQISSPISITVFLTSVTINTHIIKMGAPRAIHIPSTVTAFPYE